MSLQRRGFFRSASRHVRRAVWTRAGCLSHTASRSTVVPGRIGRRIVTGVDPQGESRIDSDTPVRPSEGRNTIVWAVRQMPAPLDGPINAADSIALLGRVVESIILQTAEVVSWPRGKTFDALKGAFR